MAPDVVDGSMIDNRPAMSLTQQVTFWAFASLVILAAVAWKIKSVTEEKFMVQQFGDQYTHYRMQVKALVPYIW